MNVIRRPALFLDRDGVINLDHGYVSTWERFAYVAGIKTLIAAANGKGWPVVVVTNQSGIARGLFTEDDMATLHDRLVADMASGGARIDGIYHCPHLAGAAVAAYDRECEDRKPHPGMLLRAARALPIDLARSVMIGDKETDMQAARAAGVEGHLFEGGDVWTFAAARIPALTVQDCPATTRRTRRRRPRASDSSAQDPRPRLAQSWPA